LKALVVGGKRIKKSFLGGKQKEKKKGGFVCGVVKYKHGDLE